MKQADLFANQINVHEFVAPLQDLTLRSDTQEPGRFRLRAEVPFRGPGPRPVVVIHFTAEATGLTPDQIKALNAEAREIRAAFALVLSAGAPRDPETVGIEVVSPEPVDPAALVIDFEVLNPTGDPFVARLLEVTTLLALIFDVLFPGKQRMYNMHKENVQMHVVFGGPARLIGSDGHAYDAFPGDTRSALGPVVTVRNFHRPTGFKLS